MTAVIKWSESITAMLSVLSDSQKAIVEAVTMRLHVKEALQYLEERGHPMSERKKYPELPPSNILAGHLD